jgi:tetratricopeptide (TPR) repeat protein
MEPLRKQLLEEALRYYQDFAREPGAAPEAQAELVAAHLRIAVLIHDLGRGGDWLPSVESAVGLMEDLLRKSADPSAFRSLREGVYRFNTSAILSTPDPERMLGCLTKARTVWEELVRREPSVPGFRNELGLFAEIIAVLELYAGRPEVALQSYRRAVELRQGLVREFPSVPHYRAALTMSLRDESAALDELGRLADAEVACREGLDHAKRLVADFSGVPAWEDLLTTGLQQQLGQVLENAGRPSEAEVYYREMLAGQESLLAGHPAVARYRYGVLCARVLLSEILWGSGRRAEATDQYRRIGLLEATLAPDERQSRDILVWFLATCPDLEFRDGARAVQIARRLVEEEPRNPDQQLTLGVACDSAGDWKGAIVALGPPQSTIRSSAVLSDLLLARAYWRLGRGDEARKCHQEALSSLERHPNRGMLLRRIRAETEAILGHQGK